MAERIIQIDSVDAYNKLYGWETLHPLVTEMALAPLALVVTEPPLMTAAAEEPEAYTAELVP